MNSIRTRILAWILSFFLVIWIGISYATYYQSRHEVEELFDAELAQVAGLLGQISATQKLLYSGVESKLKKDIYGHRYEKKIAFQIWQNGKLVLHSANTPLEPLSSTSGYSDQKINNHIWRVFKLSMPDQHQEIYTAETDEVRNELIFEITQNSLYPLTFMIPILLFTIWIGIGRGLAPVHKITHQLEDRSPDNLEPIEAGFNVPAEIKPLINAINSLFQKLHNAFERERRFTSDAAHELQTPLASIKAQSQVALRSTREDEKRHALQQVTEGINRATHLVQQLLMMARLDPQTNHYEMQKIDLARITRNILSEQDSEAHKNNIELKLEAPQQHTIIGNEAAVQILVSNIISNAIRYSPKNSSVEVTISTRSGKTELCVEDNGPGIDEQEVELIFERFYRGEGNQHIMGSGLGLSIVQRIAQLQNAELTLENRKDTSGLRFCVLF